MNRIFGFLLIISLLAVSSCEAEKETKSNAPVRKRDVNASSLINQIPEVIEEENEQPYDKGVKKNARVKISTNYGDIEIRLYDETPRHRDNFLRLAESGFYDGTLFHRVMSGFMIQGGDPKSVGAAAGDHLGMGGPGYTLPAELNPNFLHNKGALAAARQGQGNPNKRSSGSQFYIVHGTTNTDAQLTQLERSKKNFKFSDEQKELYKTVGGAASLDMDYTVYGEVVSGLEVVDKIAAVQTEKPSNRPIEDVKMTVTVISQ